MVECEIDVRAALAFGTPHLSFYQLTLEPNTVFAKKPPPLPDHDLAADMQLRVEQLLSEAGYEHYETSAHARPGRIPNKDPRRVDAMWSSRHQTTAPAGREGT